MKVAAALSLGNVFSAKSSFYWVEEEAGLPWAHPTAGTTAVSQPFPSWFGWKASLVTTYGLGHTWKVQGPPAPGQLLVLPRCWACGHRLLPDSTLLPLPLYHQLVGRGCKVGPLREASPMYRGTGRLVAVHQLVKRWIVSAGSGLRLLHVTHHPVHSSAYCIEDE